MNAVRVQYTVREAYAATNRANIQQVMADLKALNNPHLRYSTFLFADGKTFLHLALWANEEGQQVLRNLPSFQEFQRQLRESHPEVGPQVEELTLVGASWDLF